MSSSTPRPSQTTLAAGMVMAASAMVVLTSGEQLAAINSLETRRVVTEFLATSPGTGLEVSSALVLLRTALMVVAGCATAAAVLGFHVLRRSRGARFGLTLLAAPLFLVGLATGGFLTSLVAVSSLMLWIEPSRAWLEHRPPPQPAAGSGVESADGSSARTAGSPWAAPTAPSSAPTQPPPHEGDYGAPAPATPPPPTVPGKRPDPLMWACALTWGFCGLVLLLLGASLALLLADPSVIWTQLERQDPDLLRSSGLSRDDVLRTSYVTLGLGMVWSIAATGLAVLAFRGSAGGRLGLMISAGGAGAACLVGSFSAVLLMVPTLACVATVVLLMRPDVGAWVSARPPRA